MTKQSKLSRRLITFCIAATVLTLAVRYIIINFQWHEIGQQLTHMNWAWLLIGGSASILAYWLTRAMRLKMLLEKMGVSIPLHRLYLLNAVYLSLSIITPFQSGEALKIEALKRHGLLERHIGYSAFFIERVLDLIVVIGLAAASLLLTASPTIDRTLIYTLALLLAIILPCCALLLRLVPPAGKLGRIVAPLRITLDPLFFIRQVLITTLGWILVSLGWLACLRGLQIELDLFRGIALTTTVTLINIFSFIPGAVGISEAGVAHFLIRYGYEPAIAQAGAIAVRLTMLVVIALGVLHVTAFGRGAIEWPQRTKARHSGV